MSTSLPLSIVPLAVVILVLGATAFLPRRDVGHPLVALVRVLFPSWRFFDDVQASPILLVRLLGGDGRPGEWRSILTPKPRAWPRDLFWNPVGNLQLAEHVLLERLLGEVAEWDAAGDAAVDALVSYELVANLVRAKLASMPGGRTATHFQFKLVEAPEAPSAEFADLLISREHPT
jgi:hypothetical protein